MPRVTVIVPIYNVEPYVERCLRSVMGQTYKGPLECILVDDCGMDRSMDVVEQMIADYHGSIRFKVLHHEHNRGVSAARNTGMAAATGDYLFFLDSDDEITADCIEKLVEPLSEKQYDLVIGNTRTIGNDRLGKKLLNLKLNDGEVLVGRAILDGYRKMWNMMPTNKLCRTVFIRQEKLLFKEDLIYEDELWCFQVACMAKTLRAVNRMTYIYYIRENSITTSVNAKQEQLEALRIIVGEMRNFLIERHIISASAYRLVQHFKRQVLKPVQNDRGKFVQEYCQLRHITRFPLLYRIKAIGFHPCAQIHNIYYMLPPQVAATIIYWRKHH